MSSIKKNFLFNALIVGSQILFPVISFPYASRVLGPISLGRLNFSETYAKYFVLICLLGIPIYGLREVAKSRENPDVLNRLFTEIVIIQLVLSIVCTLVYILTIFHSPVLYYDFALNIVCCFNFLFQVFTFDWFFVGLEKFKRIAIRSIISRFVVLILMFVMVKSKEDFLLYQVLNTVGTMINSISNIYILRRYVSLVQIRLKDLTLHFKSLFIISGSVIAINIYSMIDTFILGIISTKEAVGYYSASVRIIKLFTLVISSLGHVLIPRISSLHGKSDLESIKLLLTKLNNFIVLVGVPLVVGLFALAEEIIFIICGKEYQEAIGVVKILSSLLLFTGLSSVYGMQVLTMLGKDMLFLKAVLLGVIVSIILNVLLIPKFDYNGAAFASVITELSVFLCAFLLSRTTNLKLGLPFNQFLKAVISSSPIFILVYYSRVFFLDSYVKVLVSSFIAGGGAYFIFQYLIFKDDLVLSSFERIFVGIKKVLNF